MPPRDLIAINREIASVEAEIDKLKTDQKRTLGDLVLETDIHKLLDADQLRDALLRLGNQIVADQILQKNVDGDPIDAFQEQLARHTTKLH